MDKGAGTRPMTLEDTELSQGAPATGPPLTPRSCSIAPHLQDEQHLDDGRGRLGLRQQQQVLQLHLQQHQVAEAQQGNLADGQLLALAGQKRQRWEVRARGICHQPRGGRGQDRRGGISTSKAQGGCRRVKYLTPVPSE